MTDEYYVEFKRLDPEAVIPKQADDYAIGYDIVIPKDTLIREWSRMYVSTGFSIGLPRFIEGKIEIRSGFGGKGMEGYGYEYVIDPSKGGVVKVLSKELHRFDCDVITGKIDPGYKGEVKVIVKNYGKEFLLPKGTKIAQMTFYRVPQVHFKVVNELHGYDRGGGLGHTGSTAKE